MNRLFSYVVDHDLGIAPNPYGGICTLAKCKFSHSGHRNIVELAKVGDWVVGTGGKSDLSAGHGKLVYAMRVDEKVDLETFCTSARFAGRADTCISSSEFLERFALISHHYFYFGANAIDLKQMPVTGLDHSFEKRYSGFRSDFTASFIESFARWLGNNYTQGIGGNPCGFRLSASSCDEAAEPVPTDLRSRCTTKCKS